MTIRRAAGIFFLLLGITVFAIRLRHAGPYAVPEAGNLRAAILSLGLGIYFIRPWLEGVANASLRKGIELAVVLVSAVVLFFAFYATLSEVEEVVVVAALDRHGEPSRLRLWVMDFDETEWVNMSRSKAIENDLTDQRVEFLRDGVWTCREARLVEDRAIVTRNSDLGAEKYAVKRVAMAIGIFSKVPPPEIVSVRLDPCEG